MQTRRNHPQALINTATDYHIAIARAIVNVAITRRLLLILQLGREKIRRSTDVGVAITRKLLLILQLKDEEIIEADDLSDESQSPAGSY